MRCFFNKTAIATINYGCSPISYSISFDTWLIVQASVIIASLKFRCECGADVWQNYWWIFCASIKVGEGQNSLSVCTPWIFERERPHNSCTWKIGFCAPCQQPPHALLPCLAFCSAPLNYIKLVTARPYSQPWKIYICISCGIQVHENKLSHII
jgi:hypothetical protein